MSRFVSIQWKGATGLRIAKFAILDSRDRRDGIIIYALTHGLSIFECDDLLNNDNLITLV